MSQDDDWPPCAWCKRDVMDEMACFNAKDICVDCCEEAGMCGC